MTRVCPTSPLPKVALATSLVLTTVAFAPLAAAGKGPLEGQPAVRRRQELRSGRLELGVAFETSIAAEYKHTLGVGPRLEYHLSDMLSVGGVALFGFAIDTSTTEEIRGTLPKAQGQTDPTPSKGAFDSHLNTIPLHGAAYVALSPVSGKMSLLGEYTVNYDIYANAGPAFARTEHTFKVLKPEDSTESADAFPLAWNDDPRNAGLRIGVQGGVGLHVYVNQSIAVDFALRNYLFSDNPSGLDTNGDFIVTDDDRRFQSHWFFGLGISGYLPTAARISP